MQAVQDRLALTEQRQQVLINFFANALKDPRILHRLLSSMAPGAGMQRIGPGPITGEQAGAGGATGGQRGCGGRAASCTRLLHSLGAGMQRIGPCPITGELWQWGPRRRRSCWGLLEREIDWLTAAEDAPQKLAGKGC